MAAYSNMAQLQSEKARKEERERERERIKESRSTIRFVISNGLSCSRLLAVYLLSLLSATFVVAVVADLAAKML